MGKRNKPETTNVETSSRQSVEVETKSAHPIKYVVIRDGYRVEDREYDTPDDPACIATLKFWAKIAQNHSWGEKVEAVIYDSKKHRVW